MSAPTFASGSVPSGDSAPFLISSPTDHRADIIIVAATGIALILITLSIRIYIRFNFSGPWLVDDTVFALATFAALVQSSLVCVSVHLGWGKVIHNVNTASLITAEKCVYVADLLYIVTLALSKHSLDLLFIRLTPYKNHIRVAQCIRLFTLIWAVVSLFVISLRCHVQMPWIDITASQCPKMLVRWQVVTAFNIISEVAIFGMSIYLVWGLRMALSQKSVVITAFAMRLPTIVFCALRMHYFFSAFFTTDPTFDGVFFSVWTQAELGFSVIAATSPCLKPFMSTISTNWGEAPKPEFADLNFSNSYGLKDLFGRSSEALSKAPKSVQTTSEREIHGTVDVTVADGPLHANTLNHSNWGSDSVGHAATVMQRFTTSEDHDGVSTRSNNSQQMIIRKETIYSVHHA